MTSPLVDELWTAVSERVGDDLRAVTRYTPSDHEVRMREDVRTRYTSGEEKAIADDTIVKQLGFTDSADRYKAGAFKAVVRVFDEAWILAWPDPCDRKSGVIVSIQRGSAATMADVEWCLDYLEAEIAPRLA